MDKFKLEANAPAGDHPYQNEHHFDKKRSESLDKSLTIEQQAQLMQMQTNFAGIMQGFTIESNKEILNSPADTQGTQGIDNKYLMGTDNLHKMPKEMANVSSIEISSPNQTNVHDRSALESMMKNQGGSHHLFSQANYSINEGKRDSNSYTDNELSTSICTYLKNKEMEQMGPKLAQKVNSSKVSQDFKTHFKQLSSQGNGLNMVGSTLVPPEKEEVCYTFQNEASQVQEELREPPSSKSHSQNATQNMSESLKGQGAQTTVQEHPKFLSFNQSQSQS